MNETTRRPVRAALVATAGAVLGLVATPAPAQGTDATSAAAAAAASPYYIGASQGFTHDSNVYRVPSGPGDTYSSTSVFAGFDQPISRQRVFGRANVSLNRYFDQSPLNNTSYNLGAGLDWSTIYNLSGNVDAGITRQLAAPTASSGAPTAVRNLADTDHIDLRARWGGPSLLSLEGAVGYSRIDYSAPEYVASESRRNSESLALYYHPGGPLRLGVAARFTHTRTPKALFDPATGNYQSNSINGKNLDLLADYDLTGLLTTSARLSYTRQTNSGVGNADFSGLTGSINVVWRATAKTSITFDAVRDAGFDATNFSTYAVVQDGTSVTIRPATGLYENNRTTNTVGVGVNYAATAKIKAQAGARYARARLASTITGPAGSVAGPETTDSLRTAFIGADYEIARNWGLACNLAHEHRSVSGAAEYAYNANTVGCTARYTVHL